MATYAAIVGKALLTASAVAVGWPPVAEAAGSAVGLVPSGHLVVGALVAGSGLLMASVVFTLGVLVARRFDAPASALVAVGAATPCRRRRKSASHHLRPVRAERLAFARGLAGYRRMLNVRMDNLERHLACLPRDAS